MGQAASIAVRVCFVSAVIVGLVAACGSDGGSQFGGGGTSSGGTSGGGTSSGGLGGTSGVIPVDGGGSSSDCKPKTCQDQGIECGPAGDGCGGLIADCGKCDTGLRCGGPNAPSKCVSPSIGTACTPKSCTDQGIECGQAGDGCGGILTCPTCPLGKQCGAIGSPSKCVDTVPELADGGACIPKTIADYNNENKNCGTQSDGCGSTVDLGGCTAPEFCGGGGPSKCAVSGGGSCTRKGCGDYPGKCGPQPDGCGGVTTDCGGCVLPEVCGGGGTASVCGGGSLTNGDGGACQSLTVASCGANQCGKIADGCGGVLDCGTAACTGGKICGGAGVANQCGAPTCTPITTCPAGMDCGSVADGCGGTVLCGPSTCVTSGQICGGSGVPNHCGGGGVLTDAGTPCVPSTDCTGKCGPIADGCGGINACPNNCVSPNLCGGGGTANVCGGGNQCTPKTVADCGSFNCGFIADGCGGTVTCGVGAGNCPNGGVCGGNTPNVCTNGNCTGGNFCGHVSACSGQPHKTRVTGVVYAPNGTLPLPGATVFVPNGAMTAPYGLTALGTGVSLTGTCDTCSATVSGALVNTTSGDDGSFTLDGVPDGISFPLVVQMGKWRGVVTIPSIGACGAYAADGQAGRVLVRFPQYQGERDATIDNIPLVAVSTGDIDGLECVYSKLGVVSSGTHKMFSNPGGSGRIQLVLGDSGGTAGAKIDNTTPAGSARLWDQQSDLDAYDAVILGCGGPPGTWNGQAAAQGLIQTYANHGGRVFATHYQYVWLYNNSPWGAGDGAQPNAGQTNTTATWNTNGGHSDKGTCGNPGQSPPCAWVGEVLPGAAGSRQHQFYNWLSFAGISSLVSGPPRKVTIADAREDVSEPIAPGAEEWIKYSSTSRGTSPPATPESVLYYTFNTPWNQANQCGRVLYSGFHVSIGNTQGTTFPNECVGSLTDQEKILAFFLFDLTSCIQTTQCKPKTCADYPANTCGQQSDGCGGLTTSCGTCTLTNQTCGGGGGSTSVCGGPSCPPKGCPAGDNCGSVPDGCGLSVSCGTCTAPGQSCGGGGVANHCGTPSCSPKDCTAQGIECGQTGDGCGGIATCNPCPAGTTCGGGGVPNKCGKPSCTPITTCPAGKNCGDAPDGCGGSIHCGDCQPGQTCGGGGAPNVCGNASCSPKDCASQGAQCGSISDQCGGVATCPVCPAGDFCNGQNLCVAPTCTPKTCAELGVECGPTADTCGDLIPDCGDCHDKPGTACGGGGVAGKCGTNPCTPKSCADVGAVCGQVADGCGGLTPNCGDCTGALSCKNGACVQACTPTTCATAGAQCGDIADGCGSILDCGPCPPGQQCGFNNIANQCGSNEVK